MREFPELANFCLSVTALDIGLKDADGLTAFDLACRTESQSETIPTLFYQRIFEMENEDPDGALLRILTLSSSPYSGPEFPEEALFRPILNGNLRLVQALLDAGVNLTAVNEDQKTALHIAAEEGSAKIVQLLLERGAETEVKDNRGRTALFPAAKSGSHETVRLLLDRGAKV